MNKPYFKTRKGFVAFLIGVVVLLSIPVYLNAKIGQDEDSPKVENTSDGYPLYQNDDAVIQLPVMFSLNPDVVSDKNDMFGYCMSIPNRDVECYTMKGRYLGVGSVELYSNGDLSQMHVLDKAPADYRQVMTNAFFRVWG